MGWVRIILSMDIRGLRGYEDSELARCALEQVSEMGDDGMGDGGVGWFDRSDLSVESMRSTLL